MNTEELTGLCDLINNLIRNLGLLQKDSVQCCGITLVQSHIIYEVGKREELVLNDLAQIIGLDKSTVSRHVQTLVEKGYVTNMQATGDRRYLNLALTDKGIAMNKDISGSLATYVFDIFNQIPDEKRAQVVESLNLLLSAIGNSPKCCKSII